MEKIIIDTDVGTNADDAIAISLAAKSPEIQIIGVTTVYGNVEVRTRIAKELLRLCGSDDVPVYSGIEHTLLRNREIYWTGLEDAASVSDRSPDASAKMSGHAVDFIIQQIMEHPGEITLVTIGPLTNIAAALIREPDIASHVKRIVMMAGVTRLASNGLYLTHVEHNIKCDPEAASVVFSCGAPITMVGLDVTRQAIFTQEDVTRMANSGTPLALKLTEAIQSYMDYMQRDYSYMCDPLAVATLLDSTLVKTKRMNVRIEYDHRPHTGQTVAELSDDGHVDVCLEVDKERFFALLYDRVFSS